MLVTSVHGWDVSDDSSIVSVAAIPFARDGERLEKHAIADGATIIARGTTTRWTSFAVGNETCSCIVVPEPECGETGDPAKHHGPDKTRQLIGD